MDFRVHRMETKDGKKVKLSIWVRTPAFQTHFSTTIAYLLESSQNRIQLVKNALGPLHQATTAEHKEL